MSAPVLEISGSRFAGNLRAVREHLAPSELMLVVKDEAYGHGLDWALDAASDVAWFGAYDVATALHVRERSTARIFAWATSPADEVDAALAGGIDLGVGSWPYLELVIDRARHTKNRGRIHLKVDTGLHRNGIRPEEWEGVIAVARAAHMAGLIEVVGAWSHLAEASDAEDDESAAQFTAAADVWERISGQPLLRHLTASAASWWRPELRGSLSRIGAFCYGIRSADGPPIPGVLPVAALRAEVIEVAEETVTIGIGTLDGLPSILHGAAIGTPAGARELRDLSISESRVATWPGAAVGDRVTVFGPGMQGEGDATSLAEHIGSVGEEILVRLGPRVRREIVV